MLRDKIAAALVVAILAAGYCHDARADGLPKSGIVPLGEVAKAGSWTGCYVGGAVGYGWTRSEFTPSKSKDDSVIIIDDIMLSPGFGCDMQVANAVFGVMGDLTWSDISTSWGKNGALDADWQWFVGARAGVLFTPKTLVYGLVGWTSVDGGLSFSKTGFGDLRGLTYGGGVENMLSAGLALKLEYRFVQFDDDTAPMGKFDGLKGGTNVDTGSHQVRLGLSYRFGSTK